MTTRHVEEIEARAIARVRQEFVRPLNVAAQTFNLISEVVPSGVGAKLPKGSFVRTILLQRVLADLRCCMLVAERGYGAQSAVQASIVYEAWVTLASIRTEEDAEGWLNHQREDMSFDTIKSLTRAAVALIFDKPAEVQSLVPQYLNNYHQLCMVKHLNPMTERDKGYVLDGKQIVFTHGPDLSDLGRQYIHIGLYLGARFGVFALLAFVHLQEPAISERMRADIKSILVELDETQPK